MSTAASHISDNIPTNGSSFEQRLRWIIGPRRIDTWFDALRISGGTRARMLKDGGIPPTYDALTRIMRTENASLSWLLGGRVAPFLRFTSCTDQSTAELLADHLDDEAWSVAMLTDGLASAWLLFQPAAIVHPKGDIHYREVVVVAGPAAGACEHVLAEHGHATIEYVQRIGSADMNAIVCGRIGTWALFGDEKKPGLFNPRKAQHGLSLRNARPTAALRVAEDNPNYAAIPPPAKTIANAWPTLPDSTRSALALVVDRLTTEPGPPPTAAAAPKAPAKP